MTRSSFGIRPILARPGVFFFFFQGSCFRLILNCGPCHKNVPYPAGWRRYMRWNLPLWARQGKGQPAIAPPPIRGGGYV